MARPANHLHKYQRTDIGSKDNPYLVFKCQMPACTHYIRKDLAEGKLCQCNRCNQPMILTKAAMLLAKPHCLDCTKKNNQPAVDAIAEFIAGKV